MTYLLIVGGIGLSIFGSIDRLTNGQFSVHVVGLNAQEIWWQQAAYALGIYVRTHAVILVLSLAAAISTLRQRMDGWVIYFFVALLGMVASVGKVGAYTNYFIESLAIACIFFGCGLARWRRSRLGVLLLPLVALQLVFLTHLPYYADPTPTPRPSDFAIAEQLVDRVAAAQGPVLSENAGWLVITRHPVIIDDPFFFAELTRVGRWNQDKLVDMLDRRQFSLVLLEFDPRDRTRAEYHLLRFTPEMLDAIDREYKVEEQLGNFFLLVPRESSASERSEQ